MRSKLKYNLEDKMSIEQINKGFEGNKDEIKNNIMKILLIFILMIVSNRTFIFVRSKIRLITSAKFWQRN